MPQHGKKKNKRSSMERDVMTNLQAVMTQSDVYKQNVIAAVEQHYQEIWPPEYKMPFPQDVRFTLTRQDSEVELTVETAVRYDGWTTPYRGKASISLEWDSFPTREELEPQIRALLPQIAEMAGCNLYGGLAVAM